MASRAFEVYLDNRLIDEVNFQDYPSGRKITAAEVKESLIRHDGYSDRIVVKARSRFGELPRRRTPARERTSFSKLPRRPRTRSNPEYQGHKNWNYWNVSLWINNDEGLYRMARGAVRSNRTLGEAAQEILRELHELGMEKTPDGAPYALGSIRAAISKDM